MNTETITLHENEEYIVSFTFIAITPTKNGACPLWEAPLLYLSFYDVIISFFTQLVNTFLKFSRTYSLLFRKKFLLDY